VPEHNNTKSFKLCVNKLVSLTRLLWVLSF